MKRIHVESSAPKYQSGKWSWDKKHESLHFEQHFDLEDANERYIDTNGYKFLRTLNQEEELIFRQVFVRPNTSYDPDTVVINDVRNLVFFLMPKQFLSMNFIEFMHKPSVHRLLHALIIYFEYFLRLVEFVLIRRDEIAGDMAQMQSEQTNEMKRIWSSYLSQYRMLTARNYCAILLGAGDMKKYYHTKEIVNISSTIKDRYFHEQFLAVATQIVWISSHRRAYYVIEMEMNRLFRSDYFILNRKEYPSFTPAEKSLLYGRNNKLVNYRYQSSPLVQELKNVADQDMPILWIGERKYRGSDPRIAELELEYMVPGPQLRMIDIAHGILGHPRLLYNTLLSLDWPSVRYHNFSSAHDPYYIMRQPNLRIPNIDEAEVRKSSRNLEHYYKVFRIYESARRNILLNWSNREKIKNYYLSGGVLRNIIMRCEKQLEDDEDRPEVSEIVSDFLEMMARLRKKKVPVMGDATTAEASRPSNSQYVKIGAEYFFIEPDERKRRIVPI
ncbi:uncharacterized protein LOC115761788 [Drosophila novamexicana]|uniref:uncharacterized protein LOC115761788 n=1 Tax=Drosophila novamexicana TaxID=47314 RepID=UPI0011E5CF0F|nr:uncharacterized protein LOC115761788 [Drosophila novamexicana]